MFAAKYNSTTPNTRYAMAISVGSRPKTVCLRPQRVFEAILLVGQPQPTGLVYLCLEHRVSGANLGMHGAEDGLFEAKIVLRLKILV